MKKLSLYLLSLALLVISFAACSDDGVDCDNPGEVESRVNDLVNEFLEISLDFSGDPADLDCDRLIDILDELIDVSEDFEECVEDAQDRADLREAIDSYRSSRSDLEC